MSTINKFFFCFLIFVSLSKNIHSTTIFWSLEYSKEIIEVGKSGEAFLTIDLRTPKLIIDFSDTMIIGIDLENSDPTFSAKVHKSKSKIGEEVYKIDFKSEKIGKNEFTITIYDFEKKRAYLLEKPIEFEFGKKEVIDKEIIPSPKNTKLLKSLSRSYGENDTMTLEFSLFDEKGNYIIGNSTFVKKLKVTNNGKESKNAEITFSKDGKTFYLNMKPEYLPLLQKINVEFNGKDDKFNLFSDDIQTTIKLSPCYLNTKINCYNCENISLDETPLIDINLNNYLNVPVNTDDYSKSFKIVIEGPLDSDNSKSRQYSVKKINEDENLYQIKYKENDGFSYSGKYTIKVYEDSILIIELEYIIHSGSYDLSKFSLEFKDEDFDPSEAFVDTEFGMILKGHDSYGNIVLLPLEEEIEIYLENEKGKEIKYSKKFTGNSNGELEIDITSQTLGYAKLKMYFNGTEILTINKNESLPEFFFNLMECDESELYKDQLMSAIVGEEVTFYLQCLDESRNLVKRGGVKFTTENYFISNGKYTSFPVKVKDLKTGNYSFNFVPTSAGFYTINIYLKDELFEEIAFQVGEPNCQGSTPFLCPNQNLCVSNRRECIIPKNDCPEETPFSCRVNNFPKCVKSQIDCDCPFGFVRCNYMKYCVPSDRLDMCANFSQISEQSCQKLKQFNQLCTDGICRLTKDLSPTQIVCPIGKVLCADLSCRDSYYDCETSNFCEGKFRCPDQSCVDDYKDCPSTISCQNKNYVCPDGTCVDSEIECEPLPVCSGDEPYRCHDNLCVKDKYSCPKNVACGQRLALCQDLICRTNCDNN